MKPSAFRADSPATAPANRTLGVTNSSEAKSQNSNHDKLNKIFHNHLQTQSPLALAMMNQFVRGDTDTALELFKSADHPDPDAHYWAGWAHLNRSEWKDAAKRLEYAYNAGIPAHGFLAVAYLELKLRSKRQDLLLEGRSVCPESHPVLAATFWREVGLQYLQDTPSAAVEPFALAFAAAQRSREGMAVLPTIAYRYTTALIALGRDQECHRIINQALEYATSSRIPFLLVNQLIAYTNLGHMALAYEIATRLNIYASNPNPSTKDFVQFYLAWFDSKIGRPYAASQCFMPFLEHNDVEYRFYAHLNMAYLSQRLSGLGYAATLIEQARGLDYIITDRERSYLQLFTARAQLHQFHPNAINTTIKAKRLFRDLGNPREVAQCHVLLAAAMCPADVYENPELTPAQLKVIQHHLETAFATAPRHKAGLLHAIIGLPLCVVVLECLPEFAQSIGLLQFHLELNAVQNDIKNRIMQHFAQNHHWAAVVTEYENDTAFEQHSAEQIYLVFVAFCELGKAERARLLLHALDKSRFAAPAHLRYQKIVANEQDPSAVHLIQFMPSLECIMAQVRFVPQQVDATVCIYKNAVSNPSYVLAGQLNYDKQAHVVRFMARDTLIDELVSLEIASVPPDQFEVFQNWAVGA